METVLNIPKGRKKEDVLLREDPLIKIEHLEDRWKPGCTFR
jgi:hypothetical protein